MTAKGHSKRKLPANKRGMLRRKESWNFKLQASFGKYDG